MTTSRQPLINTRYLYWLFFSIAASLAISAIVVFWSARHGYRATLERAIPKIRESESADTSFLLSDFESLIVGNPSRTQMAIDDEDFGMEGVAHLYYSWNAPLVEYTIRMSVIDLDDPEVVAIESWPFEY